MLENEQADLTERAKLAAEEAGLVFGGIVEPRLGKPDAIKRWLAEHGEALGVENFLAIDDHDLQGVDSGGAAEDDGQAGSVFEGHFLRTDDSVGLTTERSEAGATMLATPWEGRAVDLKRMEAALQLPLEEPTPAAAEKRLRCDDCGAELAGTAAAQRKFTSNLRVDFTQSSQRKLL